MSSILGTMQAARKWKFILIVAISALGLVMTFVVIRARARKTMTPVAAPLEVDVVQVRQDNVPIYSEWIGTTDGLVNADIRSQVSGYLLRRNYTEGAFVRRGQLLFEIDPRPFEAVVNQAKADLARAEAQVGQAVSQFEQAQAQLAQSNSGLLQAEANQRKTQLDVNKFVPLFAEKAVTQQDMDNAVQSNEASKAQVDAAHSQIRASTAAVGNANASIIAAKAQVKSAQAVVNTAELNLGFTKMVSPIDGIVGIAAAQVGDLVSPNSGVLTTVSTVDPIRVYFTVSEQEYLNYVKQNPTEAQRSAAQKQLELQLFLADGSDYPHTGKFYIADRQVDTQTGAIRIAGIFPNPDNILRPGQYARVRAATSIQENALLVPQRAVNQLQGLYRVAVVGSDNKVSIRTITPGPTVGQMWVVQDGLKAGETVLVDGTQRVNSGTMVRPRPFIATGAAESQDNK